MSTRTATTPTTTHRNHLRGFSAGAITVPRRRGDRHVGVWTARLYVSCERALDSLRVLDESYGNRTCPARCRRHAGSGGGDADSHAPFRAPLRRAAPAGSAGP